MATKDKQYEIFYGKKLIDYILAKNEKQAKVRALKYLKAHIVVRES